MKTLIILHGWHSAGAKWSKVKEIIEKQGIRVLAPDIPGFKPETELKTPWNLDDYIEWFKNFVIECKLEYPEIVEGGFYLLGHSFGGRMSIKIAAQKIFCLKGLILVSAAGIKRNQAFYAPAIGLGAKLIRAFDLQERPASKNIYNFLRIFFYRYIIRKTDYLNAKGMLADTIKNILAEDLKSRLADVAVPTKIIWGNRDKATPVSDAYLINKGIKNSELEIFRGVGHIPYVECPDKLAESIIKFIKK